MDATPENPNPPRTAAARAESQAEAKRFRRLVERSWPEPEREPGSFATPDEPQREPGPTLERRELRHGQPFMGRAVFDFGRREEASELPPPATERLPCPLCGEPNRLRHSYCKRCGFRLPWAAQLEGLPELEPRRNRLDHVVERALLDAHSARCRFCGSKIGAYDRRCQKCGRWLSSNWNRAALDAWQPDFDAWNFSQVRGFRSGCLSPIVFALALVLWRVLS